MVANLARAVEAEYFDDLAPGVQATIRALAKASALNPLCPGVRISHPAELLGMLRESLDLQSERLADAEARQREERQADAPQESATWVGLWGSRRPEQLDEVDRRIEAQRSRVAALRAFIAAQEEAFSASGHAPGEAGRV